MLLTDVHLQPVAPVAAEVSSAGRRTQRNRKTVVIEVAQPRYRTAPRRCNIGASPMSTAHQAGRETSDKRVFNHVDRCFALHVQVSAHQLTDHV